MQDYPGKLIVLEGADGSGKTTQFKLLAERLGAVGYDVEIFKFPRYDQPSSYFIRQYLNGAYGPAKKVSPYTASLFYALDRFEAAKDITAALEAGKLVLCDRYTGSNMAHQGSKFKDQVEQRGFFVWADSLEFSLLGIPRPDLNIFLRVSARLSFELIGRKIKRSYTDKGRDEHEADITHLRKTVAAYDLLQRLFPKDFKTVECMSNSKLLSIAQVNNRIWELIQPVLPKNPPHRAHSVVVKLDTDSSQIKKQSVKNSKEVTASTKSTAGAGKLVELHDVSRLAADKITVASGRIVTVQGSWSGPTPDYRYFNVTGLPGSVNKLYGSTMNRLADTHREMRKKLQKHPDTDPGPILLRVTPLAELTKVAIDNRGLVKIINLLEIDSLEEAKWIAGQLRTTYKIPGTGQPPISGETLLNLIQAQLPQLGDSSESLELKHFWPRNEFDMLAEGLYPHTSLSADELEAELAAMKYEQKQSAFTTLISQPASPLLDQVNYHFDVTIDRLVAQELITGGLAGSLQLQPATPRYGYDVPDSVEQAGLENEFIECFDMSLELFSALQAADRQAAAGYATLLGHKVRCQFTTTAHQVVGVVDSPSHSKGFRQLISLVKDKVGEVHPLIGELLSSSQAPKAQSKPAAATQPRPKRRRRRPKASSA